MKTEASLCEKELDRNKITSAYVEKLKLDSSKDYKIILKNKDIDSEFDVNENKKRIKKEILTGRLMSQHRYIFIFECINKHNIIKRVCINKKDYILNNVLIKEC